MLPVLNSALIEKQDPCIDHIIFTYPEKILQFGTGVLLRGLVDYLVDKANRQGIYKGRILMVKSTAGNTDHFARQDNLYTTQIKGIEKGKLMDEVLINTAISRVLSSHTHWQEILDAVHQPSLQTIISNTTETGIQYKPENVVTGMPVSFPGKLLALLWERYRFFNGEPSSGFVIIPTELVVNNGHLLQQIVLQLAAFNNLPAIFIQWIYTHNYFCNSLVDRIVPGKPSDLAVLEQKAGYSDELWIEVEPYLLWGIEGDEYVRSVLSFHQADNRMLITPDITAFREQKLRLLNGSHSIIAPMAFLSGFNTIYECMQDKQINCFLSALMWEEILPTIIDFCPGAPAFAQDVLDRFANPFIAHQLIAITFQESSKMNARNVCTLVRYYEKYNTLPIFLCLGFAAMLLFLRPHKVQDGVYYGCRGKEEYVITDDNAPIFAAYWHGEMTIAERVRGICSDRHLWAADLTAIPGFADLVARYVQGIEMEGVKVLMQRWNPKNNH